MYEAIFTLRQETPIIHFLHDQAGATLRATELKPKLDKFILKTFQEIFPESAQKHKAAIAKIASAVSEKKPALYKISIEQAADGDKKYYYLESKLKNDDAESVQSILREKLHQPTLEIISPSPFFANTDKREKEKWDEIRLSVLFQGDIFVHVKTWDEGIYDLLHEALPLLFCVENFGMRQSKGFGSFSEKNTSEQQFEKMAQQAFVFAAKKAAPTVAAQNDQNAIFKTIDQVWKTLRFDNQAKTSAIEDYMKNTATLEKYKVTQEVVCEKPYTEDESRPVRFVRSALGLPGLHDYPNLPGKPKVNIRDVSKEVERYKSPIMFKIFKGNIYLLANQVDEKMLNRRDFVFYVGDDPNKTTRKTTIPTLKTFSIQKFLTSKMPNGWKNV